MYLIYKSCFSTPLLLQRRRRVPISATQLIGDIKSLDKVPKHLAIMFWSDDVQEERLIEVARLCCWSLGFGVKIVSIYDAEGRLGQHVHLLQSHVNIISQKFFISEKIIPTIQITSLDSSSSSISSSTETEPDLLVNLVSRSDGRTRIVDVTKSLSEDIKQEKLRYEDVNIRELDKRLSRLRKYSKCNQRFGK
ncbi:11638_t:CDS:2 [Funneliformis geosporum]|uniref:ditrans,polycis-polyprenyl diphosphate synthase [(2E,6E)-farnesyldiphosphate specific] n=1 Tax=Funneliformis geosporum TaxID=1117311 RepID=A0A9W4SFZ8_9GLOM|nr:11638_t:CDS:2 [Funneliformis geosporum]